MQEEQVTFNVFEDMKYPSKIDLYFQIDIIDKLVVEIFKGEHPKLPLESCIAHFESTKFESAKIWECAHYLEATSSPRQVKGLKVKELGKSPSRPKPSIQEPPKLELKSLPSHLRYAYLGDVFTSGNYFFFLDKFRRRKVASGIEKPQNCFGMNHSRH